MLKTYSQLYNEIKNMINGNKNAKDSKARSNVIRENMDLIHEINDAFERIKPGDRNRFAYLMNLINNWVLSPKGNHQNYKSKKQLKRAKDQPATIHDNIDTSSRVYQGNDNYYSDKKGDLKPTQSELSIPAIKLDVDNINDLQNKLKSNKYNRYTVSKNIRAAKNDLNETIRNHRGINHQGRIDNTITPDTLPTDIPLSNRDYAKYVITHAKDELPTNENIRLDKIAADQKLGSDKTKILKDIEKGYNQRETAKRNHVSQNTVNYHVNKAIDTVTE